MSEFKDPYTAVFNSHVNDAHVRAMAVLKASFPEWHEEIAIAYNKGIMVIFSEPLTPPVAAYVALVTAFVNEER